eukprot:3247410-Alexandrium_andersonii.AAC.1
MQGPGGDTGSTEWVEVWSDVHRRKYWVRRTTGPDGVTSFTNEWDDPFAAPPMAQEPAADPELDPGASSSGPPHAAQNTPMAGSEPANCPPLQPEEDSEVPQPT